MTNNKEKINCPVGLFLELIGGKYKALILWHLMHGTLRFGQLQRLVTQATPKMLTQQLRELESAGLLVRTVYPVVPPKVEYALTPETERLIPVLDALCGWSAEYAAQRGIAGLPCCASQ